MNLPSLLNWMLLGTALLGAWWACYRLALRAERGFAYNRAYLVLGPLLAAGLPLLPLAWPAGWWGPAPAGLPGMAAVLLPTALVGASGAPAAAGPDWAFWLGAAYLAGVGLMLARLGAELLGLWRAARCLPRQVRAGYVLAETHGRLPTSSFGRLVFWDETLPLNPAEARQVLAHELAHVRQGHTYDRLLLELLRAALWFNPFVHLCARALALTHEYLADAAALHEPASPTPIPSTSYSQLLARQVASRLGFSVPLAHSFSHSQTLRRIAMIQKTSPIRRWKQWLALPLLGVLLAAVACERGTDTVAPAEKTPAEISQYNSLHKPNGFYDGNIPPPPPPATMAAPATSVAPKVYTYVEQMPQLPGGGNAQAIIQYLQSHIKYSDALAADPKEGMVFASFTVTATGEVASAEIVKGLSPAYDAAVLEAIASLPRFVPGKQDNRAVAVRFTVPVRFVQQVPAKAVGIQLFDWNNWATTPAREGC